MECYGAYISFPFPFFTVKRSGEDVNLSRNAISVVLTFQVTKYPIIMLWGQVVIPAAAMDGTLYQVPRSLYYQPLRRIPRLWEIFRTCIGHIRHGAASRSSSAANRSFSAEIPSSTPPPPSAHSFAQPIPTPYALPGAQISMLTGDSKPTASYRMTCIANHTARFVVNTAATP